MNLVPLILVMALLTFLFVGLTFFLPLYRRNPKRWASFLAFVCLGSFATLFLTAFYDSDTPPKPKNHPLIIVATSSDAEWPYQARVTVNYKATGELSLSVNFSNFFGPEDSGGPSPRTCKESDKCSPATIDVFIVFVGFPDGGKGIRCSGEVSKELADSALGVRNAIEIDHQGGTESATNWNGPPPSEEPTAAVPEKYDLLAHRTKMQFYWKDQPLPDAGERVSATSGLFKQEVCTIPKEISWSEEKWISLPMLNPNRISMSPQINFTAIGERTDNQYGLTARILIEDSPDYFLPSVEDYTQNAEGWEQKLNTTWYNEQGESSNLAFTNQPIVELTPTLQGAGRVVYIAVVGFLWAFAMAFLIRSWPPIK